MKNIFISLSYIAALIPIGWYSIFIFFVCKAYLKLGRMPYFDNPDPYNLGFDNLYSFLKRTIDYPIISILVLVILLTLNTLIKIYRLSNFQKTVFIFAVAAVISFTFLDPLGLMDWFLD